MRNKLSLIGSLLAFSLFFSPPVFCLENTINTNTSGTTSSLNAGCGYPERVRDGLNAHQYFSLAQVYLSDFRLDQAKLCLEKLEKCKPSKESAKLLSILSKCYMPQQQPPKEAVEQLNIAADQLSNCRLSQSENGEAIGKNLYNLVEKYPTFEWPYFLVADSFDSRISARALKKVLVINPNNVQALERLALHYQGNDWTQAYSYAKKAKELNPYLTSLDVEFFRRIATEQNESKVSTKKGETKKNKHTREKKEARDVTLVASPPITGDSKPAEPVAITYKFIDKSGETVFYVGPNVHVSDKFSDGLLLVNASEGRGSFTSRDVQYWNKEGGLAFSLNDGDASSASEGLCAVQRSDDSGALRWGFLDHQGKTVIPTKYAEVKPFHDGLAAVEVKVNRLNSMNLRWGFVDKKGQLISEPIYEQCQPYSEGLAAVTLNGKIGYLNKAGIFIIPPKFTYVRPFSEGLANVMLYDNETKTKIEQYIDKTGNVVYSKQLSPSNNTSERSSILFAYQLNRLGTSFWPTSIRECRSCDFHENLIPKWKQNNSGTWKVGYINAKGNLVIPAIFDSAEAFSEGRAMVKVASKYGFINTKGEQVVSPSYAKAQNFSDGLAAVSTDGKTWGYIDKTGKKVIEEKYLEAHPFSDELAKVGVAR